MAERKNADAPGTCGSPWKASGCSRRVGSASSRSSRCEGHGRAAFALAANCDPYTYAGRLPLHVAPLASFEGGLDIVGARALKPSALPRFATYVVRGAGQERARDILYARDVDRVEIVCDRPLPLQADGEDLGDVTDALLESERDAVTVLV